MTVAQFLDLALPDHCIWTTFPAGGGGRIRGAILKAMGLRPGWPDIQIFVRCTAYDSVRSMSRFIGLELKQSKGRVSETQFTTHRRIRNAGGEVYITRTIDEIYDVLANKEQLRLKVKPLIAPQEPAAPTSRAKLRIAK